jgi:hypothetical protein
VKRQAADPSFYDAVTTFGCLPERSASQERVMFSVQLIGVSNCKCSSSTRVSALSFILGMLLHSGRWRRTGLRRQRLAATEITESIFWASM